ncbi:hypothetical protein ABID08_000731 [Rhizobium binae]|uniref:Uncharacterized protein n=1 Tax=Rhizobium binae TaxID=1138190 RepID=A0ABV2MD22_9HYPH|nr:hypothetical protein [Rhizobium binae]MBX4992300.1 hypothetical protein [Rhizobium binae]NKL52783.1 hypothetical protein [Rhizobium leguminosarum bv. viciae]QSY80734.1 hypothetical protein J2J99_13510 [Rhizobium binae]
MIGALAKLIGVDKWLVSVVAVVAIAGGLFWAGLAVYNHIYDSGYDAAVRVKNAEIAELKQAASDALNKEVERQASVQNAAKAREAARIAEMQAENENLQFQIQELQREADEDPSADVPVLGAPSVRRVNKVR